MSKNILRETKKIQIQNILIRTYEDKDLPEMITIWNEIVEEGIAFPQEEPLNECTGRQFFASQTCCAVAQDADTKELHGFEILQFNAVVATNINARHLYERLGFIQLGTIPKGFRMKDGHYEDICPYYRV